MEEDKLVAEAQAALDAQEAAEGGDDGDDDVVNGDVEM